MQKPDCHRKGCTRLLPEFSLFLGRRRPSHFDGHSFCSDSCLAAHVESELTDRWHRLQRDSDRRIPRPRLGTILVQRACITLDQLREAVKVQQEMREGRLGAWLQRLGFVEEHQVTMALAQQFGLPLINLRNFRTGAEVARMIPGTIVKCTGLLPVGYDSHQNCLRVAAAGPVNFNSQEAVRRMLHTEILTFIGDQSIIDILIKGFYEPAELDLTSLRTYSSLGGLLEISREFLAEAASQRAENIRTELLEDFLWVCFSSEAGSRHMVYRHAMIPLQKEVAGHAVRVAVSGAPGDSTRENVAHGVGRNCQQRTAGHEAFTMDVGK